MAAERLKELLRVRFRGWWGDVPEIEQSIEEVLSDVRAAGVSNMRRDPTKHREYMRQYQAERRRAAGVPERRRVDGSLVEGS